MADCAKGADCSRYLAPGTQMTLVVKLATWGSAILLALCFAIVSWAAVSLSDARVEIAEIKGTRFTSEEGKVLWNELSKINEKVAGLPDNAPLFREQVTQMRREIALVRDEQRRNAGELKQQITELARSIQSIQKGSP